MVKDKTIEILNDEPLFEQLDKDYELDVYGQTMRALRSLDDARRRLNLLHNIVVAAAPSADASFDAWRARIDIDAVFTALSNIQKNFEKAVEHEATKEYEGSL